ncbi:MAG: site-2 protease family protein [bacterium]
MFGKKIRLFNLFGFEVGIDLSWIILACLITWTLAEWVFPHYYKGLSPTIYLIMGIAGALGLFASIIFHELLHSLVARRFGLPMKGITLFIFGGVAEMVEEPPSPRAELMMAIAGPLSSICLGLVCLGILFWGRLKGWPIYLNGVISYLAYINLILAAFNLLPAFPLDGGRVLRAILWGWKDNLRWATHTASQIGTAFSFLFMILGVLFVFTGDFIDGIWWFLIGMFLRNASQASYIQVLIRKALEGEKVRRFMNDHPVTVPPSISVDDLVNNYIYRHHFKMFPVEENGRLIGCVTLSQVKEIPEEERSRHTVRELVKGCSSENSISPDEDAIKALTLMSRSRSSRLMVVDDERLVGIISLKDMTKLLSLKMDLGEPD